MYLLKCLSSDPLQPLIKRGIYTNPLKNSSLQYIIMSQTAEELTAELRAKKQLLKKQKEHEKATKKQLKEDKKQRLMKQKEMERELTLTDARCANIIEESNMIKFVQENSMNACVWNEETKLWEKITAKQLINKKVAEILKKDVESKNAELKKLMATHEQSLADLMSINSKIAKNMSSIESAVKIRNIVNLCGCVVDKSFFDQKIVTKSLLPIRDGKCICLKTLKVRKRRKNDYFTRELDVDLCEKTDKAEQFIRAYCPNDDNDETYKYLLNILSYLITPWNFLKKFFVFYGESGDNGKSALLKGIESILGELHSSVGKDMFQKPKHDSGSGATTGLNQCLGKFVGTYGESTTGMLDETIIKMITGDDTITVRRLYKEAEKVRLYMKLLLCGNSKPHWRHSLPMVRRLMFFNFKNKFVKNPKKPHERKQNMDLADGIWKKPKYRDQLFTLLARQAKKLFKTRHIEVSPYMKKEFDIYVQEIDTSTLFLKKVLVPKPKCGFTAGQIHDMYVNYCQHESKKAEKKGDFVKKLKLVYKPRPTKLNGNTVYDVDIPVNPTVIDVDDVIIERERSKNEELQSENEELKKQLEDLQKQMKAQKKKLKSKKTELKQKEKKIKKHKKEIKKLTQQLEEYDEDEKEYKDMIVSNFAKQAHKDPIVFSEQEEEEEKLTDEEEKLTDEEEEKLTDDDDEEEKLTDDDIVYSD